MHQSKNIILTNKYNKDLVFDYRFIENNIKKPVVIFSHGFKGFKDWGHFNLIADYFANHGIFFLKLNFAFNGTTAEHPEDFVDLDAFGNNNFSKEIDDIVAVKDYLKNKIDDSIAKEIDLTSIHVMGHSKGGASSLITFLENPDIKSATLWAPVLDIISRYSSNELELWQKQGVIYIPNSRTNQEMPLFYQLAEDTLKQKDRFNIPNLLLQNTKPIKILHGENDTTVSLQENLEIIKEINSPLIELSTYKETDHVFDGYHPYTKSTLPTQSLLACKESIRFIKQHSLDADFL